MKIIYWILGGVIVFIILVYTPPNNNNPKGMIDKVNELNEIENNIDFAREVYNVIDEKYTSPIRQYFREFDKVVMKDMTRIWNAEGYLASQVQAQLFKRMLLLSGRFQENQMKIHHSWCKNSPHDWVELTIDNKLINVDLWAADHGGEFGQYYPMPCDVPEDLSGEIV